MANLKQINLSSVNLQHAIFIDAYLPESNLRDADLAGAKMNRANFNDADLSRANLAMVDLIEAYLSNANLFRANLSDADLSKSSLTRANLSGANLKGAKLNAAEFQDTLIGYTDLSETLGLEETIHYSPSVLDVNTIQNSHGNIPKLFLRGCGLSDIQIEMTKLADPGLDPEQVTDITYKIHQMYLGGGIQYYLCFISYNSNDGDFARKLHDDLQENGVRCWFAPEDMKIGDQIRTRIDQEIRLRDKLLVILSENSVKSEWVSDEVEGAIEEESKSNRLVLFPIRLDDTVMNTRADWAAKIKRRRHISDFSNWKDKVSYQKAFERLLRDLKATGGDVNGE